RDEGMAATSVDDSLELVPVGSRLFSGYRAFATAREYDAVLDRARDLKGLRVVEINSTAEGGGVATMLHSVIPALRGLGLDANWYAMRAGHDFFVVTKVLFDLLQSEPGTLDQADQDLYLKTSEKVGQAISQLDYDVLVIHDPQPLGARAFLTPAPGRGTIWRVHLDLERPNPDALCFLLPFVEKFDLVVLEDPAYRLAGIPMAVQRFVPDAIDPLSRKNRPMSRQQARRIMARVGIDAARPVVSQVARFDPLKNPTGVVEAYRIARRTVPGLQLAMLGTFVARDDPTARQTYECVKQFVGADPDVHLYIDPRVIGPTEVDAFQTGSDVVLLFSVREGFGIAATEAMWKRNAVVAGDVGGLPEQIVDGVTGFLVSTVDECASRIVTLVNDRELARELGDHAHQRVRDHFLLPRLIEDWLGLFAEAARQPQRKAA
ncbi:MAG: glycosyltransferase, partial [Chloroflexota bacterium]